MADKMYDFLLEGIRLRVLDNMGVFNHKFLTLLFSVHPFLPNLPQCKREEHCIGTHVNHGHCPLTIA